MRDKGEVTGLTVLLSFHLSKPWQRLGVSHYLSPWESCPRQFCLGCQAQGVVCPSHSFGKKEPQS